MKSEDHGRTSLEADRAFLTRWFLLLSTITAPLTGLPYAFLGSFEAAGLAAGVGVIALGGYIALRRGVHHRSAANVGLAAFWAAFFVAIGGSGGLSSPLVSCIVIIPVFAGLVGGVRSSLEWGVGAVGQVVLLGALSWSGRLPAPLLPIDTPGFRLAFLLAATLLVVWASALQQIIHFRAQREADSARTLAESANHAKSEFLMAVSHELRTPMNGILGSTELLCETRLDDEQTDYTRNLRNSGHRLMALIEDLLELTELSAEDSPLDIGPCGAIALTRDFVSRFSVDAEDKGLELWCTTPKVELSIRSDAGRIRRCLQSLISNALKFTDHGSIEVRVESTPFGVRWTVEDTGPGIPESAQRDIFTSFHRLDGSSTRKGQGLGLGLAIFVGNVERLRGRYGVSSRSSEGSRFWFEVPDLP